MSVELDPGGVEPAAAPPRRLTRRQRYAVAALLLAGGALLIARNVVDRPPHAANSPPPYPSSVAAFSYLGALTDAVPGGHQFALRVRATATGQPPYDLVSVRQDYPGVSIAVSSLPLPTSVRPGSPVDFTVLYVVTDCAAAPRDAGMPFLDVTLRNAQAIQTLSQILGPDYARDLSRNLHITCPNSGIRT
ncbi:Tat pathway signal sequence domain protein [Kitasatospora sp. McL0602]|uniref:Tat pathway signal sequence domain protein n=1 Tax=Kitasatospora sp. McL0602 TaxID=3439530 RepID=UPI003F8BF894